MATDTEKLQKKFNDEDQALLNQGLRSLMKTPGGRYLLRWLFARAGFGQSISTGNALTMSALAGRQDLGNELFELLLSINPHAYGELIEELATITAQRARQTEGETEDEE